MKLNQYHLEMLLFFNDVTKRYNTLSARKQKLVNDLVTLNILKIDNEDNGFIYLTGRGNMVLAHTLEEFTNEGNV